jgi:predicted phosphoribosyltransferase
VVVAAQVAVGLSAPLDVLVVRKLGVPWHPELGMGAIAEGGVLVVNQDVVRQSGVSEDAIAKVRRREEAELVRRATLYRRGHPAVPLEGTTAVLVDDGLATGYTARAAVEAARAMKARRVVLAVPVGSEEAVRNLREVADLVVCPLQPADFYAVGQFYSYFDQTSDDEVIKLLDRR